MSLTQELLTNASGGTESSAVAAFEPLGSLFLIQWGSNEGYAIAPLEHAFYRVGLALANGDSRLIHFGYPNLLGGRPRSLPDDFVNITTLDFQDVARANIKKIASFVQERQIKLVWIFDVQPSHPLFRHLRGAGVAAIVGYWGAPISSRMPRWKLLLKRLEVMTARSRLDGLIFESQAMADLALLGRGVPARMIDVVPLGIDLTRYSMRRSQYAYEVLGIPTSRKIVLYAGHVDRRKGVHVLVEAAIELLERRSRKDLCILICGNRPGESDEFERMYRGQPSAEWIRFLGYRSDMTEIYSSTFCGVIPSAGWDSFPRTSIEMGAMGLPVVASRLGGLPEAVLDGQTGVLFPPGDAGALADCLERLLDSPELAERLGQRGRERCEREFTVDLQHQRLVGVARKYLST